YFMLEKYETYPILNIHFKNDNKFTVESIAGFRKYNRNNIKDCYAEQREVLADLKNIFPNINQHGTVDKIHKYKKAGKGTYTRVGFKLPSGNIRTECRKWGKTIKYASGLNIILSTNSYMDWLRKEAYK
ncbi:MAG: hypothetical protein QF864_17250, partial [SAR202 cluster bacterium]|nr:hypothetical protein [SAR202 cluster bacterium]